MICISTITQNINGSVLFQEKSTAQAPTFRARVRKTGTLDGGVDFDHMGYAAGDSTIEIEAFVTSAQQAALETMLKTETLLTISTKQGFFKGAIASLRPWNGDIKLTFEIKEAG